MQSIRCNEKIGCEVGGLVGASQSGRNGFSFGGAAEEFDPVEP
jgi:hypothetical protein